MNNPVDWFPWGDEALSKARAEDKPILLSVGYAACHWCHVMEHESFEDDGVARLMNERFVSIKVDREERPDIDHIYMTACHLFTGSGGWPLTVFLTPDLRPYFAGTYFPKEDKFGRPGFLRMLRSLSDAWLTQRDEVTEQATRFHEALQGLSAGPARPGGTPLTQDVVTLSAQLLLKRFDAVNGGFGEAPKFPNTLDLLVLEAAAHRGMAAAGDAVLLTCRKMAQGGIHDHLGGGFHRYSTDERWLVPHFEKMLYDNALIPRVFLSAYRRTAAPFLKRVVEDVLVYVTREMTHADGGFFSTQDADSEGEEGRFFVWTPAQISTLLGEQADAFCQRYGVTDAGNFEHATSVLHLTQEADDGMERARRALFEARETRPRPARDEKILAGWNGLMASAFCDAAATLQRPDLLARGVAALDFILTHMRTPDGGIFRVFHTGGARIPGFLEDYAMVAQALVDAHRAGAGNRMIQAAVGVCDQLLQRFGDEGEPGFFNTEAGAPGLLVRARAGHDDAVPSGASLACSALLSVGTLTGNTRYVKTVERILDRHSGELMKRPTAYASLTLVLDRMLRGVPMVVVAGGREDPLLAAARSLTDGSVLVLSSEEADGCVEGSLLAGKTARHDGKSAAYVCANQSCQPPVTDLPGLLDALSRAGLAIRPATTR